jgi:hypothetical protein
VARVLDFESQQMMRLENKAGELPCFTGIPHSKAGPDLDINASKVLCLDA